MDQALFAKLCKDGKFKEALKLATQGHEGGKFTPSRFAMDKKNGQPIFYRGNKRVEQDDTGEWNLAKDVRPDW